MSHLGKPYIKEEDSLFWRRAGEPKDLQIWRSEPPLLAQVYFFPRDSLKEWVNQVDLTLGSFFVSSFCSCGGC